MFFFHPMPMLAMNETVCLYLVLKNRYHFMSIFYLQSYPKAT